MERAKYVLVPCLMGPRRGRALLPRADAVEREDNDPSNASVIPSVPSSTRNSCVVEDFMGLRRIGLGVRRRVVGGATVVSVVHLVLNSQN